MKIKDLKSRAKALKNEVHALYLASRDPRTPWYAKGLAVFIIAYALSPVDLIPDFIPVIGYLDDLILVPAGIALLIKLIPPGVMEDCRRKAGAASAGTGGGKSGYIAAVVIICVWIAAIGCCIYAIPRIF